MSAISKKPDKSAFRRRVEIGSSYFDFPSFGTPAMRFLEGLAALLDEREWHLSCRTLHQVLMFVTHCSRSDAEGIRMPDLAQPGHAFLVFANGDGVGCCCGGNVALDELDAAREAAVLLTAGERRRRLVVLTKLARDRSGSMPDTDSRALAIEVAGLLVGPAEIEALRDVENALPALVILTKRERSLRSVRWKTLPTTLPGKWLGTCELAGSA